jgi:hypothetical protein
MQAFIPTPVEGFHLETLDGEIILLHPTRSLIIYCNPTAALIWQLCDGVRSVDEITGLLCDAYPESQDDIRRDVPEASQILVERGALKAG